MTGSVPSARKESRMTQEELIELSVGGFRRWQLFVCLAVFLVNIPLAWQELAIVFLAGEHRISCADAVPLSDPCKCTNHTFNNDVFTNTIVSQWDLVCGRDWLTDLSQTILMLGILVGNITFGFLSDRFGRRKPLVAAAVIQFIAGVSIAFAPWLWLFMFLRFLVAIAAGGIHVTAFVITVEIVGRKYRSTLGILFQLCYYVGHAALGGIAYFLRDWHYLQLTISIPALLLVTYYWILPESPRWLLAVGRLEQAITVLEHGARFNGMPTRDIRYNIMSKLQYVEQSPGNALDLVRNANIRIKTISICFNWLILGLSFFGVAQYMGHVGGNIYLNVAVSGLIQIPGNIIIIFVMNKYGRKYTLIVTYSICAVSCLLITVIPSGLKWPIALLGSIGMMGISLSFATMFVFSGELYPTIVRNVGIGTSSMFAKFGSMTAPFIDGLSNVHTWIPPLIYGTGPLLAILASLKLPETLNTKLPDTIEEAEQFGQDESLTENTSEAN
ncbi:uncharacterized protein CBL_07605 [Carabus blaptoides fortunei]